MEHTTEHRIRELGSRWAEAEQRGTHVAVRRGEDWLLAGVHLSPTGGPPPFATQRASSEGTAG